MFIRIPGNISTIPEELTKKILQITAVSPPSIDPATALRLVTLIPRIMNMINGLKVEAKTDQAKLIF